MILPPLVFGNQRPSRIASTGSGASLEAVGIFAWSTTRLARSSAMTAVRVTEARQHTLTPWTSLMQFSSRAASIAAQ